MKTPRTTESIIHDVEFTDEIHAAINFVVLARRVRAACRKHPDPECQYHGAFTFEGPSSSGSDGWNLSFVIGDIESRDWPPPKTPTAWEADSLVALVKMAESELNEWLDEVCA